MKKLLLAAFPIVLFSCNSEDKPAASTGSTAVKETATPPINTSGYVVSYSTSFEIGDPRHAETVAALWKDFDDNNLANSRNIFADSVQIFTYDGGTMAGTRDSVLALTQTYRNMYSTVKSSIAAIFPVKSIDKNENWTLVWGTEVHTDKKTGKVDSVGLQETWRLNKDGKIDMMYQHGRTLTPPKQ